MDQLGFLGLLNMVYGSNPQGLLGPVRDAQAAPILSQGRVGAMPRGLLEAMVPSAPDRFDNPQSLRLQLLAQSYPGLPDPTRAAMAAGTLPPIARLPEDFR